VFISEMSTLSDGSWAELRLEYEYVVVVCWYLLEVVGWFDCAITDFGLRSLCTSYLGLTSDYWTSVPVIGLRSL